MSVKFILNKRIKYYTKETFKLINLIAIALFIVMTVVLLKYKMVYSVSISGEQIGYIENEEQFQNEIEKIKQKEGTQNIAFIDIENVPQYEFTFINKNKQTNESEILAKIQEQVKITYKYYAVTLDGNKKSILPLYKL